MVAYGTLLEDIEQAMGSGSGARRTQMLRSVTDLFMGNCGAYAAEELGVFDDVMGRLAEHIEARARAELANRLADAVQAPVRVVKALAFDDIIDVAEPILARSNAIEERDIIENASTKGQDHLLAISRRASLSEAVTDVLVTRGDQQVVRSVAGNDGARFSEDGFRTLVRKSESDDLLAMVVGGRKDVPRRQLEHLIAKASDLVRERLMARNPELAEIVPAAAAALAGAVRDNATPIVRDYAAAAEAVKARGPIQDKDVRELAHAGHFAETVVALSTMCKVPHEAVEAALQAPQVDQLLIVARAADLTWQTAKQIIHMVQIERGLPPKDLHDAAASFERLQIATAQRIMRFYLVRRAAGGESAPAAAG